MLSGIDLLNLSTTDEGRELNSEINKIKEQGETSEINNQITALERIITNTIAEIQSDSVALKSAQDKMGINILI